MSAIDSHEHAHIGNFFSKPIYWFLEQAPMSDISSISDGKEIIVDNGYFCLGGGSGEHPALMVNLDAVILTFMDNLAESPESGRDKELIKLSESIADRYVEEDLNLYQWSFDLNQWPLESWISFSEEYKDFYRENYPDFEDDRELQTKMMDSLALFIIYEMPFKYCLKDPELVKFCEIIKSGSWDKPFKCEDISLYNAGVKKPLAPAGKVTRNGQTVWGYSLDDWIVENNPMLLADKLEKEVLLKSDNFKVKI